MSQTGYIRIFDLESGNEANFLSIVPMRTRYFPQVGDTIVVDGVPGERTVKKRIYHITKQRINITLIVASEFFSEEKTIPKLKIKER